MILNLSLFIKQKTGVCRGKDKVYLAQEAKGCTQQYWKNQI